jgi:hypothetical protein
MELSEFRQKLMDESIDDILTNVLLSDFARHVSKEKQDLIKEKIAKTYGVNEENIQLIIVGSAKLGFSISEKKLKDGTMLPRYRSFAPTSDIDIAIVSQNIFEVVWNELTKFSVNNSWFPWDSGKLGDYLICGWLRPDYFPKERRLRRCDDWWDTFRSFSADRRLGRRRVRGGIFYSFEQLKSYQSKALKDCIQYEKFLNEDGI